MSQLGKIGSLPSALRDQINQRLQELESGQTILPWLNALPEVKALVDRDFQGRPVNEMNLSNWRRSGFRDWQNQQDALAAVRRLHSEAAELGQATCGAVADQLALCLTARIAVELQKPPAENADPARELARLRRWCADLDALRKGDQRVQRLQLAREKFALKLSMNETKKAAREKAIEEQDNPPEGAGAPDGYFEWLEKELHLL